jgi:hypothetical protein
LIDFNNFKNIRKTIHFYRIDNNWPNFKVNFKIKELFQNKIPAKFFIFYRFLLLLKNPKNLLIFIKLKIVDILQSQFSNKKVLRRSK